MSASHLSSNYRYAPENCDVRCVKSLNDFRAKRDEWLHWLHEDEHHAIANQISAMLWSDAVFRLVNESRKQAADAGGEFATQSGIIARALDKGYVAEQVIAFRRLIESAAKDPKKQVISLKRLLDDIKENSEMLTREMFVCYDGLPFENSKGAYYLPPPDENGVSFGYIETTGPKAFGISELHHECFDKLMRPAAAVRARDDTIGDAFFEELYDMLKEAPFGEFRTYANKVLLHAADELSRGKSPIPGVNLEKIWVCHKAILRVANQLSKVIRGSDTGGVPTPQFDVLEHWEAPFAPQAAFTDLMDKWQTENGQRDEWNQT